jgi:hypothetical protein
LFCKTTVSRRHLLIMNNIKAMTVDKMVMKNKVLTDFNLNLSIVFVPNTFNLAGIGFFCTFVGFLVATK